MRKIIVTEFMTLDGVMEAPENWAFDFQNEETGEFKTKELFKSDTILVGEVTYTIFAESWPSRTGDFADRMNSIPKYVVTTNDGELTWNNSHVIKENIVEEIARLKQQPGKDILVPGSGVLVQTLLDNDLVDELRLLRKEWPGTGSDPGGRRIMLPGIRANGATCQTLSVAFHGLYV